MTCPICQLGTMRGRTDKESYRDWLQCPVCGYMKRKQGDESVDATDDGGYHELRNSGD